MIGPANLFPSWASAINLGLPVREKQMSRPQRTNRLEPGQLEWNLRCGMGGGGGGMGG